MNSLFDIYKGTLYNMDTSFLCNVGYKRSSVEEAVFYIYQELDIEFPFTVFFKPEGKEYDYNSFIYTLTECKKDMDLLGRSCYVAPGTTSDVPELRNDLRINVSFPVDIQLENGMSATKVILSDISAGGFMFVASNTFELDTVISFLLPFKKSPAYITGIIKHKRPTRRTDLIGYGCQFKDLNPATEAAVRNFVFQEELIQRRKLRENK